MSNFGAPEGDLMVTYRGEDRVLVDARQLASGTIATLTGKRLYSEIDTIRDEFVGWLAQFPRHFACWHEAWNEFSSLTAWLQHAEHGRVVGD